MTIMRQHNRHRTVLKITIQPSGNTFVAYGKTSTLLTGIKFKA